jgi:hypothetical protein
MSGHVFVSHGSEDSRDADSLAVFIESKGVRAWIAPRDVRPGQDYSEQLQEAIEGCAAFVVLITEKANRSPYVRAETEMAFSTGKPIFPIRTSDIQPAPGLAFFLKIRHWTDAFGPGRDASLARLGRELQALAGAPVDPPATAPPVTAPPAAVPPPPPAASAPNAVPAPAAAPGESLLLTAIGPNSAYYLERWRQMDERGASVNWNWPACLVNLFWFAYRKMWGPMIGLLVAFVVLGIIGAAGETAGKATLFISIGISFVTGSYGNLLYRRQTQRLIAETAALDEPARIEALRARGGVSRAALFVLLGIFAVLMLLAIAGAANEAKRRQAEGAFDTDNTVQPVYDQAGNPDAPAGEKRPLTDQELDALQDNY